MAKLYIKNFKVNDVEEINKEFTKIENSFTKLDEHIVTSPTTVAPRRFSDFSVVYADGVGWNPGQGAGLYMYFNNRWNKFTFT